MDRRKFITGLTLTSAGLPVLAASTDTSILGTPNSVKGPETEALAIQNDRMKLSLSRLDVPVDAWPSIEQSRVIWDKILLHDSHREEFQADPELFFINHNIPKKLLKHDDMEIRLLRAIMDRDAFEMAREGDYRGYLTKLQESGVFQGSKSALSKKISRILRKHRRHMQKQLKLMGVEGDLVAKVTDNDDMQWLMENAAAGRLLFPGLAVAAAIAAIVTFLAIYVSIGVNFGFAAFAGGILVIVSLVGAFQYASGSEAGNVIARQRLAMVAPELFEDMEIKVRVAKLLGDKGLAEKAYRDLVKAEVNAFVEASEEVGLCSIDVSIREDFLARMENLGCRAIGLAT